MARWLETQGLTLETHNYTIKGGEIDLVMRDADVLVFVEVRYRRQSGHGSPLESITYHKQRKIILAARHYLAVKGVDSPCRFDVVAVTGQDGDRQIDWIKAAFEAF